MTNQRSEGDINLSVLLSHGLLTASGFYGLTIAQDKELKFAGPAFSISLLAGCTGFLENLTGNEMMTKVKRYTSSLCDTLVVPLVATEVCLNHGVLLEMAAINLVYPMLHYLCKHIFENESVIKDEYLDLSHSISIAAIAYFSFMDSKEWGVIMTIAYALSSLAHNLNDDGQANITVFAIGNYIYASKVIE